MMKNMHTQSQLDRQNLLQPVRHLACVPQPTVTQSQSSITLEWPETPDSSLSTHPPTTSYHYLWLRDNCQCPQCVHPSNRQKLHSSAEVSPTLRPKNVRVVDGGGGRGPYLEILW